MSLKICPDCDRKVSSSAQACPNCGRGFKTTSALYRAAQVLIVVFGLIATIGGIYSYSSESATTKEFRLMKEAAERAADAF